MLWTIISENDIFYSPAQCVNSLRSSNPYDYIRNGYAIENASLFGGKNDVVFNCDISGRRTGSHVGASRI